MTAKDQLREFVPTRWVDEIWSQLEAFASSRVEDGLLEVALNSDELGLSAIQVEIRDQEIVNLKAVPMSKGTLEAAAKAKEMREVGEILTPAEFKSWREVMGLSTQWLADRWGLKSDRAVKSWENSESPMPLNRAKQFLEIREYFLDQVAEYEEAIDEGQDVFDVPRLDSGEFPARFWRSIVVVASLGEVRINYEID